MERDHVLLWNGPKGCQLDEEKCPVRRRQVAPGLVEGLGYNEPQWNVECRLREVLINVRLKFRAEISFSFNYFFLIFSLI
jgi:hypothetical protein